MVIWLYGYMALTQDRAWPGLARSRLRAPLRSGATMRRPPLANLLHPHLHLHVQLVTTRSVTPRASFDPTHRRDYSSCARSQLGLVQVDALAPSPQYLWFC